MKALFFGSIGTIVETSEIQRQSFNLAFKEAGLNWYWYIATYCDLLRAPGGKKRIRNYSKSVLNENIVDLIHSKKEEYFEKFLSENLSPREGVTEIIDLCTKSKIKLGFITTTSLKNINSIKTALLGKLDFSCFDIITSIEDVKNPKPDSEVYAFALKELGLDKNDVYVIEDTKANQSAAIELGITCFLNPGEYALVGTNDNPNYEISKSISSIINNT